MPTTTTRLGLKKFAGADFFHILDWDENTDILDLYPGIYVCDSGSRPTTWGGGQTGMAIYEADTHLVWIWNGAVFERKQPIGWLGGANRHTTFTTASLTPVVVVQQTIHIPNSFPVGSRRYTVKIEIPSLDCTAGQTEILIMRDTTQLQSFIVPTVPGSPVPVSFITTDTSATADSTYDYALQANAVTGPGGTVTFVAGANNPIQIDVTEI